MYLFTFKEKLSKLNKNLYVNADAAADVGDGWKTAAILLRISRHATASNYNYADTKQIREYLMASDAGWIDQHICGVPIDWVPEHDIISSRTGKLLARGWRGIVLHLVKIGLCDLDKARKVFSSTLKESDYDYWTDSRRRREAGFVEKESARAILKRQGFQNYA